MQPYVDAAVAAFGADRLMFGSDWPIANLAGGYKKVWEETLLTLSRYSKAEQDAILGGTAIQFYGL
ncbi:Amidohydrolase [compost metagenome]